MSIQQYNTKVNDILGSKTLGKDLWNIFYGVELEVEVDPHSKFVVNYLESLPENKRTSAFVMGSDKNTPIAHFICDALWPHVKDFCIIKRDGSLTSGMEVVSLPLSLSAHHTQWDKFFDIAPKMGLRICTSCGMHVHVSREILSPLQIGKIIKFLHDKANLPFIKIIAGRIPPEKYANISHPRKISDYHKHNNRYDGINITGGMTIEFRIFKGTLKKERMLANIEFCAAMVAFTWPSVAGVTQNQLKPFLEFVDGRYKDFPYLHAFLVKAKMLNKPKYGKKPQPLLESKEKENLALPIVDNSSTNLSQSSYIIYA